MLNPADWNLRCKPEGLWDHRATEHHLKPPCPYRCHRLRYASRSSRSSRFPNCPGARRHRYHPVWKARERSMPAQWCSRNGLRHSGFEALGSGCTHVEHIGGAETRDRQITAHLDAIDIKAENPVGRILTDGGAFETHADINKSSGPHRQRNG